VPVNVVVTEGDEHVVCCRHSPVQLAGTPQTLGVPAPPQVFGAEQVPHWSSPPQPSPIGPQSPAAQTFGTQAGAPHTLATPPPPHVWPEGQLPH
jgi:hypothetical protein